MRRTGVILEPPVQDQMCCTRSIRPPSVPSITCSSMLGQRAAVYRPFIPIHRPAEFPFPWRENRVPPARVRDSAEHLTRYPAAARSATVAFALRAVIRTPGPGRDAPQHPGALGRELQPIPSTLISRNILLVLDFRCKFGPGTGKHRPAAASCPGPSRADRGRAAREGKSAMTEPAAHMP